MIFQLIKVMKPSLIYLAIVLACSLSCIEKNKIMDVNYFEAGIETSIYLDIDKQKSVLSLINELVEKSTDALRLLVDDARINSLKQNETCIEVVLNKYHTFSSEVLGKEKVKKVFLPLTGDFIGNEDDPIITIFLGDEGYFSGPYRNTNGYSKLIELKNLITNLK